MSGEDILQGHAGVSAAAATAAENMNTFNEELVEYCCNSNCASTTPLIVLFQWELHNYSYEQQHLQSAHSWLERIFVSPRHCSQQYML